MIVDNHAGSNFSYERLEQLYACMSVLTAIGQILKADPCRLHPASEKKPATTRHG